MQSSSLFKNRKLGLQGFFSVVFICLIQLVEIDISLAAISKEEAIAVTKIVYSAMSPLLKVNQRDAGFRWVENDPQFLMDTKSLNTPFFYTIHTHGGVLKHPEVTRGVFMLMVCHEFGHVLGGGPLYGDHFSSNTLTPQQRQNMSMLSVEGQADFFATNVCMKKVLSDNSVLSQLLFEEPTAFVKTSCRTEQSSAVEQVICTASAMLAEKTTRIFSSVLPFERPPTFDHFDSVGILPASTLRDYPSLQCRLLTMFNGALFPDMKYGVGEAPQVLEKRTGVHQGGGDVEPRPRCWYVPSEMQN